MRDGVPPTLVVDASVAIAMIRLEPAASILRRILISSGAANQRLVVPDGFWIELVNVLVRRYAMSPEDVVDALRELDELGMESIRIGRAILLTAIDNQHKHRLSAYDAMYLALAEAEDARLLTLDHRLAEAAGERAVRLDGTLPHRLAETPAAYGRAPLDWGRFGPYLARLRAEAAAETTIA